MTSFKSEIPAVVGRSVQVISLHMIVLVSEIFTSCVAGCSRNRPKSAAAFAGFIGLNCNVRTEWNWNWNAS